MIKGITQSGRYVTISGGMPSNPYISPGSSGAGMVRYNPNMNAMEVNDGVSWKEIGNSFASVGLTHEAEELLDWAREQRNKQLARQHAAEKNPALRKAYEAIRRAEENFDLLESIAGQYDNDTEVMQVSTGP